MITTLESFLPDANIAGNNHDNQRSFKAREAEVRMITKLTKKQKEKLAEYRDKWIKIGLSTEPTNRARALANVPAYYAAGGLKPPKTIVFAKSPLSAMIIANILTSDKFWEEFNQELKKKKVRIKAQKTKPVDSAVYSAVRSAAYSEVDSEVDLAVNLAVNSAVYSAVGSAVYSEVDLAVNLAVYSAVDSAVYSAVDSAVGSAVDPEVNLAVNSEVDSAVRSAVSSAVYSAVRSAVGSAVYSEVNLAVNLAVGSANLKWISNFAGGNLWAGWQAFYDYFDQELKIKGCEKIRPTIALSQDVGWIFPYDNLCILVEKPTQISMQAGRLHSETSMAIRWADGWGIYSLSGVTVPDWVITTPKDQIDPKKVLQLENTEQRAACMRFLGLDKFLDTLDAELIDQQGEYKLYYLIAEGVKIGPYLRMKDSSSPRVFLEGVGDSEKYENIDPTIKTVEDALKWRAMRASKNLLTKFNLKLEAEA